ncbi:hypothetical protein NAS141_04263 [Sulfitobacter sp. NAS-14.1]|nr:hypothetical protein NAS141_04263 [Sulfitobacter sp. NAS-14.1]
MSDQRNFPSDLIEHATKISSNRAIGAACLTLGR